MAMPGCLRHIIKSGWCFAMVARFGYATAAALTMRGAARRQRCSFVWQRGRSRSANASRCLGPLEKNKRQR